MLNNMNEMIDAIENALALIDTPIGRMKYQGEFADDVRKNLNEVFNKYKHLRQSEEEKAS